MPTVSGPVRRLRPVLSASVARWGSRERKSALPLVVSSIFEGVGVCGEELEPAPNAAVMLAYLGDSIAYLIYSTSH